MGERVFDQDEVVSPEEATIIDVKISALTTAIERYRIAKAEIKAAFDATAEHIESGERVESEEQMHPKIRELCDARDAVPEELWDEFFR